MQSGVYTLKRAVQALGSLPTKRTALGRALHEWRASLLEDLGGADVVSTQQVALVDLAVRTKLLVDSVDAYVLAMLRRGNRRPAAEARQRVAHGRRFTAGATHGPGRWRGAAKPAHLHPVGVQRCPDLQA
jgi:hypothetical protein